MASLDTYLWQSGMLEEYQSIQAAGTRMVHEISELPAGRQPVGSKWVFKVKYNADRSLVWYEVRIVPESYSWFEGFDHDKTFVPVTRNNSLRLIIALATHLGLDRDHLDIKSAFWNGDLVEEIWMILPSEIGLDGRILRLYKQLSGLKQALLAWFENRSEALAEIGFISLPFDPCVFIRADHKIIVVVYADDFTTTGSHSHINRLIDHLLSLVELAVKDRLKYILVIQIKHTLEGMELWQYQYMTNILARFEMDNCRPVSTPFDTKISLVEASDCDPVFDQNLYQCMIGSLTYIVTWTRPDVAFSLSYLSRFYSHPLERHHNAVKRVFRYLPGTRSISLKYQRSPTSVPLSIVTFCDSDYACCRATRHSVSGYAFMSNGCAISWLYKKQQGVACSTIDVVYMALATTSRQASWHLHAYTELHYAITTMIMANNPSRINVAVNSMNNPWTEHIDVAYHFTN